MNENSSPSFQVAELSFKTYVVLIFGDEWEIK